jgi:hypothetical protein
MLQLQKAAIGFKVNLKTSAHNFLDFIYVLNITRVSCIFFMCYYCNCSSNSVQVKHKTQTAVNLMDILC